DDRRDQHLDGLDKGFAERLHLDRQRRVEMAEQDPDQDRADDLEIEVSVERLARCGSHGLALSQAFLRRDAAGGAAGSAAGSSFFLRPPDTGSSSALCRRSEAAGARVGWGAASLAGAGSFSSCAKLRFSASIRLMTLGGSATSRGATPCPLVFCATSSR